MALSSEVLSAPIANIKVLGDIKPPTCKINGVEQNDVVLNFGKISTSLIPLSNYYELKGDVARNKVTITCDAETYLTFIATDTYADSQAFPSNVAAIQYFHLVNMLDTNQTIGGAVINWDNVYVDGKPSYISRVDVPEARRDDILYQNIINGFTAAKQSNIGSDAKNLNLISGKVFSAEFGDFDTSTYNSFIFSKNIMNGRKINFNDGIDYIGEAVISFSFGV